MSATRRTSVVALLATLPALLLSGLAALPTGAAAAPERPGCTQLPARDGHEPRCNPYLADSPWPAAQRSSYAQHSSPLPGPTGPAERIGSQHLATASAPVIVSFSPPYADGGSVVWASTVGFSGEILKVDAETGQLIDKFVPQVEAGEPPMQPGVSGAYNLVDADNHLVVGQGDRLLVYGDAVPGERTSEIARLAELVLPPEALCGDDRLVGITMTYRGRVAFATQNGVVGTVPRDPALMTPDRVRTLSINDDCAAEDLETVSNSISSDERGGLYVVTSGALYRFADTRGGVREVWRGPYASAEDAGAGRLGAGSGSTPSLMGTGRGDDRFVVITDGQEQVHLVLMWRDRIPADWRPVRPGASRRIACEVPVTYGLDEQRSVNEQSVLLRGNSAVLVNNLLGYDDLLGLLPSQASLYTQLTANVPGNEPHGIERIDWDPRTRTCHSVWTNPDVSIPNAIPTLSAATRMVYAVGLEGETWSLQGIDLRTGELRLSVPTSASVTSNSAYAATTVGPDGSIWTGTFGGVTRFFPCGPTEDCPQMDPVEASVGQLPTDPADLLTYLIGESGPRR